jgi:hypothetical protein
MSGERHKDDMWRGSTGAELKPQRAKLQRWAGVCGPSITITSILSREIENTMAIYSRQGTPSLPSLPPLPPLPPLIPLSLSVPGIYCWLASVLQDNLHSFSFYPFVFLPHHSLSFFVCLFVWANTVTLLPPVAFRYITLISTCEFIKNCVAFIRWS